MALVKHLKHEQRAKEEELKSERERAQEREKERESRGQAELQQAASAFENTLKDLEKKLR